MLCTGAPLQVKRLTQTESKGMEKDILCKREKQNHKKDEVAILNQTKEIQNKGYNKRKKTFHNDKGSIQQEVLIRVNIYGPSLGAPKYIKQISMDVKGEIESNTLIRGDFNSLLTSMDRSSKQKINKQTAALNDTLEQINLIHILEHVTQGSKKHIQVCLKSALFIIDKI